MDIKDILNAFDQRRILVLGDIMLDHYIWGRVERISPEAPVPVLDVQREDYRLGGAANVAVNLQALGAKVYVCGTLGDDHAGRQMRSLLKEREIDDSALVLDSSRPTTTKTRIGAVNQQIVRIDRENRTDIHHEMETELCRVLSELIPQVDAVIIEDYNKGLLTAKLIDTATALAAQAGKLVCVDPKQKHFFRYEGVDVFKPNFGEMQKNLGLLFETDEAFYKHAWQLKQRLGCKALVVTRGEQGLYLFEGEDSLHHVPSFAREVFDVSGAGDTVISALTLALSCGSDLITAATIANHAAGIVCGKMGTATANRHEILQSYHEHSK